MSKEIIQDDVLDIKEDKIENEVENEIENEKEVVQFPCKNELMSKIFEAETPTREENIELVRKTKEGNQEAKEELMIRNGKLILSTIKKYFPTYTLNEDLLQEGLIGIQKAVDMFDETRNTAFSTYAVWWIRQSIGLYLTGNEKLIRLPVHIYEKIWKVKKMERANLNAGIDPPTVKEIAKELGITEEEATELKTYIEPVISLEAQLNDSDGLTVGDMIPDEKNDISNQVLSEMTNNQLQDILKDTLTERELDIIKMRFGFEPYEPHTLDEIGKKYGITRERARQIETKCLKRLKHPKKKKEIAELYDL